MELGKAPSAGAGKPHEFGERRARRLPLHSRLTVTQYAAVSARAEFRAWCTLATFPLFQAIVTASQLVSVTMPLSAASPRQ
jgi:hypothetical protein